MDGARLAALANLAVAAAAKVAGGDGDDGRSQIFYDTTQYPLASPLKRGLCGEYGGHTRVVSNPSEKHTKNGGRCFGIIRVPVRRCTWNRAGTWNLYPPIGVEL